MPDDEFSTNDTSRPRHIAVGSPRHPVHHRTIAGWREWVALPGFGVPWVKAKLDTGARSSALHAYGLERFERDGRPWVRFEVHPWQRSALDAVIVECAVVDERLVRSSTGHPEHRPVVNTGLSIAGRLVDAEVTLTRRDEMGFRMLVGREALRHRFVVDPGRSFVGGRPPKVLRRRNRVGDDRTADSRTGGVA